MGTQQSRSGHGRQGSHQQGQQSDHRPQQDRDLQRNKQSDRSQQQHQEGNRGHQQQQAGTASEREARSAGMRHQPVQGAASASSAQQSQLGGRKDFTHRMENEGREQNRERGNVLREQSEQNRQPNVYGEGNYAASRQYDDATKQYVESGRVESAARAAAPKSQGEARDMEAAEAEGKRHAKGEDPALDRRASPSSGESSGTPRPGQEEE